MEWAANGVLASLPFVKGGMERRNGRMPVEPLWLPLLRRAKNFLCYIGRGVVLRMGAGCSRAALFPARRSSAILCVG